MGLQNGDCVQNNLIFLCFLVCYVLNPHMFSGRTRWLTLASGTKRGVKVTWLSYNSEFRGSSTFPNISFLFPENLPDCIKKVVNTAWSSEIRYQAAAAFVEFGRIILWTVERRNTCLYKGSGPCG